jgi:polynucleotide 5'-kinase involved in rRNA processing
MAARRAIGDSGREQALIRTVRGRGYQFTGAVAERAASGVAASLPRDPPIVIGREGELERLERLLELALAGRRQLVLVTGEAGAGKTTLVESFVARAAGRTPLLFASARCIDHRGPAEPYMPMLVR